MELWVWFWVELSLIFGLLGGIFCWFLWVFTIWGAISGFEMVELGFWLILMGIGDFLMVKFWSWCIDESAIWFAAFPVHPVGFFHPLHHEITVFPHFTVCYSWYTTDSLLSYNKRLYLVIIYNDIVFFEKYLKKVLTNTLKGSIL